MNENIKKLLIFTIITLRVNGYSAEMRFTVTSQRKLMRHLLNLLHHKV